MNCRPSGAAPTNHALRYAQGRATPVAICLSYSRAGPYGSTGVLTEWQAFVRNQLRLGGHGIAAPKLVCIDIQPYGSTQAPERGDILNIGGFSDAVFHVVASYLGDDATRFVAEIEAIEL